MTGPLQGVRIIKIAGLGPGPFCGMLLSDFGADVIQIDRPSDPHGGEIAGQIGSIFNRGKRRVTLNLKEEDGRQRVLALLSQADGLIEGMRPGVMERLGLGPAVCLERRRSLVYGRMTGWDQDGPLSHSAGHDINYVSLAGGAWYAGEAGSRCIPPPSLVGDLGGGALYLAASMLAALLHARQSGKGQVVDAAVVDGVAHLQSLLHSLMSSGQLNEERGSSWIDGAPWYSTYTCKDGRQVSVGAFEAPFFSELMTRMGLAEWFPAESQFERSAWPAMAARMAQTFASQSREYWCEKLEGTDACFAPVLAPTEAASHPHNATRGTSCCWTASFRLAPRPVFRFSRICRSSGLSLQPGMCRKLSRDQLLVGGICTNERIRLGRRNDCSHVAVPAEARGNGL